MYRLAFHFIGELSLSLIFICVPLYMVGIFFEALFTTESYFWSYAQGFGVGIAILIYFIVLIKSDQPKINKGASFAKLGDYITEFNSIGIFQVFKYANSQML